MNDESFISAYGIMKQIGVVGRELVQFSEGEYGEGDPAEQLEKLTEQLINLRANLMMEIDESGNDSVSKF